MAAVRPKSLHVGSTVKRRRKVGARTFVTTSSAARTGNGSADMARLKRLEAKVAHALVAVEDEIDYRVATARWENHVKKKTRLLTGEEVWRELGLPD